MKKLIALLLCLCMMISLVACGDNADKNTEPTQDSQEEVIEPTGSDTEITDEESDEDYNDDEDEDETEPEEVVIRENGKLPEDIRELSDEELLFYIDKMMAAAIELDLEAIKEYDYYEESYDYFENIAEDEKYAKMYKNTIGSMIYIASNGHVIYKDPYYMYARWYTEMWKNNSELPQSVEEITIDELDAIYDKYYADAPYIIGDPDFYDEIRIIDGYIKVDYNEIFENLDLAHINDMQPAYSQYDTPGYAYLLFGDHGERVGAYEEIAEDDKLTTFWESLFNHDLDALVTELETLKYHSVHEEGGVYADVYTKYYKDEEMRKVVKAWIDENVQTYRDEWYLVSYMPADFDWFHGGFLDDLTDEERAIVESLDIHVQDWTIGWDEEGDWGFGLFFDIIKTMENLGVLE